MLLEELLRCQIREWYPTFKSHTFPTLFVSLPVPFLRYIQGLPIHASSGSEQPAASDAETASPPRFFAPRISSGRHPFPRRHPSSVDPTSHLDSLLSGSDDDSDDGSGPDDDAPSFPDLEREVDACILELGGAALPKLNWSAPKDATWLSADGSLSCGSFGEVAVLLHASDSVAHDLSAALPSCEDYDPSNPPHVEFFLALRKWRAGLRPDREFRCFVRHQCLVAVTQRDPTAFYPSLLEEREELLFVIELFFRSVIAHRFASKSYTFDVYINSNYSVKVVDFNPWGAFTLPLLFSWEELEAETGGRGVTEFRLVESQWVVRPGLKTAVPYDYLDVGEGSGWDQFLRRADEELKKQANEVSSETSQSRA